MPCPVMASVVTARMKPIMAARPFSFSEKMVNPCGTDWSCPSALMCKRARFVTLVTCAALLAANELTEDGVAGIVLAETTGDTETNAEVFMMMMRVGERWTICG